MNWTSSWKTLWFSVSQHVIFLFEISPLLGEVISQLASKVLPAWRMWLLTQKIFLKSVSIFQGLFSRRTVANWWWLKIIYEHPNLAKCFYREIWGIHSSGDGSLHIYKYLLWVDYQSYINDLKNRNTSIIWSVSQKISIFSQIQFFFNTSLIEYCIKRFPWGQLRSQKNSQ